MNKAIAGFHILTILSEVDNDFDPREGLVIVDYLKENFPPLPISLDKEMDFLSSLSKDDYQTHFETCLVDFYKDSTSEERISFLKFAVNIIKADEVITDNENKYLNYMYDQWDIDSNT
jgi:hypothetical protein